MSTFVKTSTGFLNLDFIARFDGDAPVIGGPFSIRFYAAERSPENFDGHIGEVVFADQSAGVRAYALFIEEITTQRPGTGLGNRMVDIVSLLEPPPEPEDHTQGRI